MILLILIGKDLEEVVVAIGEMVVDQGRTPERKTWSQ